MHCAQAAYQASPKDATFYAWNDLFWEVRCHNVLQHCSMNSVGICEILLYLFYYNFFIHILIYGLNVVRKKLLFNVNNSVHVDLSF